MHDSAIAIADYVDGEGDLKLKGRVDRVLHFAAPEASFAHVLRGVERNQAVIVSPPLQRVFWWLYRAAPALLPYVWTKVIAHIRQGADVRAAPPPAGRQPSAHA